MKIELPVPIEVSRITQSLQNKGFSAYIVGGCVRDLLMNRIPRDWDVTTNAKPEDIEQTFTKTFYENNFGTVTVVNEEVTDTSLKTIEITPFRRESEYIDHRHPEQVFFAETIEEDLKRRDFTINALAYNPQTGELIDNFSGTKDIKDKIIRTVGTSADRFEEDALRIMRAVRLATELGFNIEPETKKGIEDKAVTLNQIAKERIREEFNKMLLSNNPMMGLEMLKNNHLLDYIVPELTEAIGVTQNGAHIYDVWEHLIRSLQHAADRQMSLELRLAALFHDIGKPASRRWSSEKNNWTFYGHEVIGARMVKKILQDLKYSKKIIDTVEKLVRYHMFFMDIEQITLSAVRRIVASVGPEHIEDLMKLRICDRIGMGRPKENPYRLRKYEAMIDEAMRAPTAVTMLKINGTDLMQNLKLSPGPKIGYILNILLEEILDDPNKNTKEYLENQAISLSEVDEKGLKTLSDKAKIRKDEVEQGELKKIRKKHSVD
ncbi:MAG TPA: HD domain-containing protein [Candidatus Paceibacterota bacterium]